MIVELEKIDGEIAGWSMKGENPEEIRKLAHIRDMEFMGYGPTVIEYNGRTESNNKEGNPGILHWVKKKFRT